MEDYMAKLMVIDRLEIGPVQVDPNRLKAAYKITRGDKTESTNLTYRYEENVFDRDNPDCINLAAMIAAQVALNYGLFCKELVFHDTFDRHDRRFIQEMAGNTAREIYVNKFLHHNSFLEESYTNVPVVKLDNYFQAEIIFSSEDTGGESKKAYSVNEVKGLNADNSIYSVLSSGGKDSLLSYGLLNEMGYRVHPVFINESGGHWFTALNSYRYFSSNIPDTARVWTDSDRLFNWMLRHLPFIRKDFNKVRSDEYPVRLWTVAVFLFGALPVLRKRGAGRLIIGDEYDTTLRSTYHGITHYNGLFDQSRYFDNSMTRYFYRKGWGISQFSILRPLSELLIEKILAERYPDLHKNQTSCHSSHKSGDRMQPCGKCEKCRRIVGMLTAVDINPQNCGYTAEQIDRCLKDLHIKGISPERHGIEHLAFLLKQKNLIPQMSIGDVKGRKRPHIMSLRFDSEKSPMDCIPLDLREPLYRIFKEHADGIYRRSGRSWIEFDLWNDQGMERPFPFDSPAAQSPDSHEGPGRSKSMAKDYLLAELTWPEARKRFKEVDIALLPVGAIEQHGPHLPLDCDSFDAEYLSVRVAEECCMPRPVVLPLVPYGVSYHHEDFSGTISINPETLSKLVYDIGMSAVHHGITKLVIINGHGGNGPALHFAAQMINRDAHIFTCVDTGETSDFDIETITETPNDVHAGEIETSTTLATRPHLVKHKDAKKFVPRFSSKYLDFTSKRSVGWYAHTSKISRSGVLGDPTRGTMEKGEKIWKMMINHLVEFIEDLKKLSLDDIYQKRY